MKDLPINGTSVNQLNVRPNLFNHNFVLLDWVIQSCILSSSSSSFIHTYSNSYNTTTIRKKKEVKTELAIHWVKHNKRKKCVAAKGAKLSSWLPPQSGYKWVEVIQTTNVVIQARNHKKKQNKNIYAHVNEHHWRKANHVWTKSHNGSWFELRLTNSELLGFSSICCE